MPKWKKDVKEFTVLITYNKNSRTINHVPKPILILWRNSHTLKFNVRNDRILVSDVEP